MQVWELMLLSLCIASDYAIMISLFIDLRVYKHLGAKKELTDNRSFCPPGC